MKNNISIDKIVPYLEDKLHVKFESLINKKGVLIRKQGEQIVIDPKDEMCVIVKLSDTTTDRSGEVLIPEGCDYSEYMNNPLVCLFHDYSILPVGKITELQVANNSIYAKIKFATTEKCKEVYQLVKEGILSATSVGFVATEELVKGTRQFNEFIKNNTHRLSNIENINKIITKWTLLEESFVNIGCNQNALVIAKSYCSNDMINKLAKVNKIDLKEIMEGNTESNTPEVIGETVETVIESNVVSEVKTEEIEPCTEEVKKEVEVAVEEIEDAGTDVGEEAFTPTEVTPPTEVMPSQEIKEEETEETEVIEHNPDNSNCECEDCKISKERKAEYDKAKEEVKEEVKYWKVLSRPVEILKKEAILKKKGKIK
jgi:hypothetical protein